MTHVHSCYINISLSPCTLWPHEEFSITSRMWKGKMAWFAGGCEWHVDITLKKMIALLKFHLGVVLKNVCVCGGEFHQMGRVLYHTSVIHITWKKAWLEIWIWINLWALVNIWKKHHWENWWRLNVNGPLKMAMNGDLCILQEYLPKIITNIYQKLRSCMYVQWIYEQCNHSNRDGGLCMGSTDIDYPQ